ncbi:MAG: TetR/AcrR family transcriptional regulator [Eubacteriaceae bacterium]|jgi:AcrR family transcriptional regulator|nr:TetR/AcrR family transcriptional regulator [Eubacteriaceae bacterium]
MEKELSVKHKRTMAFIIEAASDVMENEGESRCTMRQIADRAGYNVATLYNYFTDQDHLMMYASVKYISAYADDLDRALAREKDPLVRYKTLYDVFLKHAFARPAVFYNLFYGPYRQELEKVMHEYSEIFPGFLDGYDEHVRAVMLEGDIYRRDKVMIDAAVSAGEIDEGSRRPIMVILSRSVQSLLQDYIAGSFGYTAEDQKAKFREIFEYLLQTGKK